MKRILFFAALFVAANFCKSQPTTTGKIDSLKDGWGETITYKGEIKNKMPNGIGVATYNNNYVLYYTGHFANGKYNGQGTLMYKDGSFLTGEWDNGKITGQGTHLSSSGDLYIGAFVNGKKDGSGLFVYKDNGLLQGNMKEDQYDGRCIYISGDVGSLNDNIYVAGKKTGSGYQYDLSSKKLFEGEWRNGDWVASSTASYFSFMKDASFTAEKTDEHILMGITNKENYLDDTAFFYDLEKHKRYFGIYRNGFMKKGLIIKNDSTRFVGTLDDNGAYGLGHYYKIGKFYDEGNYTSDYLNGSNSLSIDLEKKTVYYGDITGKADFSGKAFFTSSTGTMYVGDYTSGNFTGQGYKITSDGYCIKGTWEKGEPTNVTSITNDKGELLNIKPTTFSDALSTISRLYKIDFDPLFGQENYDLLSDDFDYSYKSILQFPGSMQQDYISEDADLIDTYCSIFAQSNDPDKAKAKYNELCKQVMASKISLQKNAAPVALTGTINQPEAASDKTISTFTPASSDKNFKDFKVGVMLHKNGDEKYEVLLLLGDSYAKIFEEE